MHSALGESAVPAGIEVITIRTLPAVAVSIASKVKYESLSTYNKLALDVSNAIIQIQVGDGRISGADGADISVLCAVGIDALAGLGEVPVRAQVRHRNAEEYLKRE